MVSSCIAVYVLANNTRVVPYFEYDDYKYGTTRVLFACTYTAKQMKSVYYYHSYIASRFGISFLFCVIKKIFTR